MAKEKKDDLELYNKIASTWWDKDGKMHTLRLLNEPRFVFFDRFVPDFKGLKVIDIGCGGGFCAEFLAKRGAHVTGTDPSEGLLKTARAHAQESKMDIHYVQGVGEKIPLPDNEFDVAVCVDVFEHVDDPGKVANEVFRLLKPGGVFLFDTVNRTIKSRIIMIWLLEHITRAIPRGVHQHNKFIKPEELTQYLLAAGFKDLNMTGLQIKGKDPVTKKLRTEIGPDMSVLYIGCAVKPKV